MAGPAVTGVPAAPLAAFIRSALERLGADAFSAEHVSRGLTETSLRGVDSHGVRLFPHYSRALEAGRVNGRPDFRFSSRFEGAAVLHADDAFGHASGVKAMDWAVERARRLGSASVAVRRSSHFGAAAYFTLRAAEQGLVGLAFTNADALVVPTGGGRPFFGTNPLAFAAPTTDGEPFSLDMATSQLNWNKVLRAREAGEPLPPGAAVDGEGRETRDASLARALMPSGGYKGFGLGAMVDILCASLTGGPCGPDMLPMFTSPIAARRDVGHFFMALEPAAFDEPGALARRVAELRGRLRAWPALDPAAPVQAAGDPETAARRVREAEGIPVPEADRAAFAVVARKTGLRLPWEAG